MFTKFFISGKRLTGFEGIFEKQKKNHTQNPIKVVSLCKKYTSEQQTTKTTNKNANRLSEQIIFVFLRFFFFDCFNLSIAERERERTEIKKGN